MSYELDQLVQVNISLLAAGISQAGFGVPLIAGANGTTAGMFTIASAAELTTDHGYLVTDPEYLKAVALFAQSPSVPTVRVAKLPNGIVGTAKNVSFTGTWTAGDLDLLVQGESVSVSFSTDEDTSFNLVAVAIAALDDITSCSWNGISGELEILSAAGTSCSFEVVNYGTGLTNSTQEIQANASTVESDLNTLTAADKDFYAVLVASDSDADIKSLLSYANANGKLMLAKTNDALAEISSETASLAYTLSNASETRAVLVYQKYSQRLEQADAALAGIGLPQVPGSITWKFKTPVGISQCSLSVSANVELMTKGVNIVTRSNGVNFTKEGTVSSGQFIDVIRGIDWLEARIQENVLTLQLNNRKIPYTQAGLTLVSGAIREILRTGVTNGLLTDDFSVSVPELSAVLPADKANRILRDVSFSATLQGAVHKVIINGTVSV